jgi:hypothetical protein
VVQQPPTIAFDDAPLDEARRMSRGPRITHGQDPLDTGGEFSGLVSKRLNT